MPRRRVRKPHGPPIKSPAHLWIEPLGSWSDYMKSADRPATTLTLRRQQLTRVSHDLADPWAVDLEALVGWMASRKWATETKRSHRAALRSFYGWARATGRIDHDPAALLPAIKPPDRRARPAPDLILTRALAHADERVQLMLLLAAWQGLRRGEIARMHTDDLTADLTGWSLLVHGKGNRERLIPCHDEVARRIGLHDGWVFPGGVDGHLGPIRVGELLSAALGPGWTGHQLRHRFATATYAGTRDLVAVQELLGHQKPETTRIYVRVPDDAMRAALAFSGG